LKSFEYTIEINAKTITKIETFNTEVRGDKIKPEVIITRYGSIRIKKEARPKNASLSFLSLIIIFLIELNF
jgi:hypothetical protein